MAQEVRSGLAPFDPLAVERIELAPRVPTAERVNLAASASIALVLAAHIAGLLWLLQDAPRPALPRPQTVVEVVFLAAPPPPQPAPPQHAPDAPVSQANSVPRASRMRVAEVPAATPQAQVAPQQPRLRLFDPRGGIVGLQGQVEQLDRQAGASAVFDYQIAGIAEAEKAFALPQAVDYTPTRFDRYYAPPQNVVDELLERAVKASTLVVMVPVPGMPGYSVGCAVVVIAAVGSCGLSEPSKLVYDIDDPTTLSADEAAACQDIWNRITSATRQSEHRRLREIYELGCRLPLADVGYPKPDVHPQGFPSRNEWKKILRQ